jgi:hypothetical protein
LANVPPTLSSDEDNICINGGFPGGTMLERVQEHVQEQVQEQAAEGSRGRRHDCTLLDAGEHFNDVDCRQIFAVKRAAARDTVLPCDLLHDVVMAKGLVRPAPAAWRRK